MHRSSSKAPNLPPEQTEVHNLDRVESEVGKLSARGVTFPVVVQTQLMVEV
jgi:hypothetical protein